MIGKLRREIGGAVERCGRWIAGDGGPRETPDEPRQIGTVPADALAVTIAVPPEPPKKSVRKPFRRTRSESQMAHDWETARDKDFQREARALIAERLAAKRRKEKRNGNDHKKG